MSTHRLYVLVTLVLAASLIIPQLVKAQLDLFQHVQKRSGMNKHYCGKHLSNALQLMCNGQYNSMFKKSGQEMEIDETPFAYDELYPFRSRQSANAMIGRFGGGRFRRYSRGVHDECCAKPCSLEELTSYCGL
ncbi:LIRP [Leptopilina heterotoma]|uniref:LIRP n=1 Tax=Leptopilina heterotoma TaxID=63436 RepID=UPI001CA8EAB8|nr:LIRP [Leptopilina heterotoma]XP_043464156.1 LIRP [Leptopilina heterotoma]XP_043464157.1 LIRP [Leptopilina heterotoma]XP_043464160.1 LIRP [Leptopilina heterotoma]